MEILFRNMNTISTYTLENLNRKKYSGGSGNFGFTSAHGDSDRHNHLKPYIYLSFYVKIILGFASQIGHNSFTRFLDTVFTILQVQTVLHQVEWCIHTGCLQDRDLKQEEWVV